MVATFHISFYEPWQGALMTGDVRRHVKNPEEACKMRDEYTKYYQKKYGTTAIVNYTVHS